MQRIEYVDFDLSLDPDGDGYRAKATGPAGEAAASLRSFPEKELRRLVENLLSEQTQVRDLRVSNRISAEQLGEKLFESVFVADVRQCFLTSLIQTEASQRGLRLRLNLPTRLASWPWEYLRHAGSFLAMSAATPIVRHLEVLKPVQALCVRMPLRVLVVVSNPAGVGLLQVEQEWKNLRRILGSWSLRCKIKVDRLEPPTLEELTERLHEKPYHILHFIGHGGFDQDRKHGYIVLETKGGGKDLVSGQKLANLLSGYPSLRLVVLNACEGARSAENDRFRGVAQSLMQQGFPAVIAMQRPVTDKAAISFSKGFYRGLAKGRPIDAVLSDVRKSLYAGFEPEWGTPVLHMRSPDGQLFKPWINPCLIALGSGLLGLCLILAVLSRSPGSGALRPLAAPVSEPIVNSVPPVPASDSRCPSPPGLDMNFAYIPAGALQRKGEKTAIRPFCIGRFEVTQKQWKAVGREVHGPELGDEFPVGRVKPEDARRFLKDLEKLDPKGGYRLPADAEWEYAARSGSEGKYHFGDNPKDLYRYGNCESATKDDRYDNTAPVGSFLPNGFNLYDMHGNVWEWMEEGHRRGGSFKTNAGNCELTSIKPAGVNRLEDNGLRIVRVPVS